MKVSRRRISSQMNVDSATEWSHGMDRCIAHVQSTRTSHPSGEPRPFYDSEVAQQGCLDRPRKGPESPELYSDEIPRTTYQRSVPGFG